MFFREVRYVLGATLALLCIMLCQAGADALQGIEIVTPRPANTFISDEAVEFLIRCDRPLQSASWTITDHAGAHVASGTLTLGGPTPATLRVYERPGPGYYALTLKLESGEVADAVFCVLPPPDEGRGDGRIFGLGYVPRDEAQWQIIAQMGGRHVRAEFPWPEVEREPGVYRLDWVNGIATAAQERGIQLTVLTGHTPRHYGQMPIDAEGRVATAWFKWQPERTIEWYRFIDTMARTLLGRGLEADAAHPTDTLPRGRRPLVIAWEVWSEADQNFYYGDWDRYLDMLRIAYGAIRSRERVPVVYGSCGHMTQMNYTLGQGCGNYFDMVAYHPHGSDPDYELMHWFRNMPQALIARGAPRDTAFSECDFHAADSEHEAGFILRLYATLRAWRQPLYVRSGCTGGVFSTQHCSYGLVWQEGDRYVPRPAYVGFAVARWLLESARYVGPLDAPEGVRVELFMRGGVPMVVAWSDAGPHQVSMELSGGAQLIDCLGGSHALRGATATIHVSEDTVAVVGVSRSYVRKATMAAIERTLTTELGHESPFNSSYVDPLEADCAACVSPDFADRVRSAVDQACATWESLPPHGPAALFAAQRVVGEGMVQAAKNAHADGELTRLHTNTIWRLAQLVEDLGGIADGVGERWRRMNNVSPGDLTKIRDRARDARRRVAQARGDAECPFADRLLDRALHQLDLVSIGGGHERGAWWAATLQVRAAHALTAVEEPELRRAFVVAVFPTAEAVTKGKLLPPNSEHTLLERVYNFLPQPLSGTLHVEVPDEWSCAGSEASFWAPAGGPSEAVAVPYCVPENPTPWVQKTVIRPWANFDVDVPEPLDTNEMLYVAGQASAGRPLMPMCYRVFVGAYPSQAAPASPDMCIAWPVRPTAATETIIPALGDLASATRWGRH